LSPLLFSCSITVRVWLTLWHVIFQVKDALQLYAGVVENQYRFLHCWFILHHEYKWNSYLVSLSTPNAESVDKTAEGSKDDTLPSIITRPIGRDKSKKMRSSSALNSLACLDVLRVIGKSMSNELKKQQVLLKVLLHVGLNENWLYRKRTFLCSK
jgi:hypothetical protein